MEIPAVQLELEFDSPKFFFDTADILSLDMDFELLVDDAQKQLDGPSIIETSAKNYPILVPPSLHECPMWVLWLPEAFSGELELLTAMHPMAWERSSTDLLMRRVTFEWYGSDYCIVANSCDVNESINNAYPGGKIVIVFVTPTRMSLRTVVVDDEIVIDLQCRGSRCDANYRPVREYSDEELAAAMVRSKQFGNAPLVEGGRTIVQLEGRVYRYDQPRQW